MLKAVIAAALIAASLVLPSFSFAQSAWRARVESIMRQILPKEAKCSRAPTGISTCEYVAPKFELLLSGSSEGSTGSAIGGLASAFITFKPPLTQEEQNAGRDMVLAFFKTFNFEQSAIRDCIGRGFQRDQFSPEEVKDNDKQFKLACYGARTWNLIMRTNNEF